MRQNNKKIMQNIPVAIIGMGCLFPRSSGLKEYWRLIFQGEDAITEVPETHWSPEDYFDKDPKKPDHIYCKRGGFLSPVSFDPAEFGIPPSSLEATDTSQLLGLVAAKMALEDSGYGDGKNFNRETTSVVLGVTGTQELVIPLSSRLGHPKWRRALKDSGISHEKAEEVINRISDAYVSWQENSFPGLLGNVVAGRISNRLDLGGTNCVVDAACASSMSAIHLALLELLSGRSNMVVTGGVDTLNDIFMHMCFSKTYVLSPTGDAKPFSKDADGVVLGEGIGMLVLKRLEDAEKDGDRIYAMIRGLGSSSDGKSQSIYAPRQEGQAKALRMAYENADVDPTTVELIEAHGTGTRVGDQVEFKALNQVIGGSAKNKSRKRCALGSVKSMIGHTKAAAGAAGLIKAALSIYHKVLPPTLKADEPDPDLGIDESPFYLSTETRPWFAKKEHPRRSGVSSFGFGGSNFHVVIEEYRQEKEEISWDGSVEIVALSASTKNKLSERLRNLISSTDKRSTKKEISILAAKTRSDFSHKDPYRLLFVLEQLRDKSSDLSDSPSGLFIHALDALESDMDEKAWGAKNIFYSGPKAPGKIAFVFPGQGSQYVGMCRDLVCIFPEALDVLERANEKYKYSSLLSDFIYPVPVNCRKEKQNQEKILRKTDITQPAIGAVSLSMLKILERFGIKPDATCGHSYGELPALYAASCIDEDTLLMLSIARGKFMAAADKNDGAMLAVKAPIDELAQVIEDTDSGIVLANRNSPNQGVLSGSIEEIAEAEKICKQKGFQAIRLPVSAAFHSKLVKDAQKPFMNTLKKVNIIPSDIPVFSNTTGMPYPADSEKAKKLLGEQILCPVDFIREIENMYDIGVRTFVEVGPKSVLTGLVKSILKDRNFTAIALDASSGRRFGVADLAKTLCHLASLGYPVKLTRWENPGKEPRKQLMSLPISGANYRKQGTESRRPRTEDKGLRTEDLGLRTECERLEVGQKTDDRGQMTEEIRRVTENKHGNKDTMDKDKQKQPDFIQDALRVVQEGLKSMQALQMQTAETHKKFLETQTEASRTLQEMMENTQRLAEVSLGLKPALKVPNYKSDYNLQNVEEKKQDIERTNKPAKSVKTSDAPEIKSPLVIPVETAEVSCKQPPVEPDIVEPVVRPEHEKAVASNTAQKEIEKTMLDVVSQLTGYPVEMLGLDMDIEADLGIDSIKRVEILSTLEEKMPDLPSVSPEIMGTLKTLGQITEYLGGAETSDTSFKKEENNKESSSSILNIKHNNIEQKEIEKTMLDVVSQLTGYPVEMLGLDMDIEADLGIDSIKRVEILSTLEEKMPDLPSVSPEIMGTLKTLGQIAEYLAGASKNDAPKKISSSISSCCNDKTKVLPEVLPHNLPEEISELVKKKVVSLVKKPLEKGEPISIPHGKKVFVTDDSTGLAKAIVDEFASLDIDSDLISLDILKNEKDLSQVAGLIILPEIEPENDTFLKDAFKLTHHVAPALLDAAGKAGALFATITRLDGAFGFKGRGVFNPLHGGLAGLAKTAAIEWQGVCCHALDIAPDWKENKNIAKAIVAELLNSDPSAPVEIGLEPGTRFIVELESSPYPEGKIDLEPEDVVIITGGARGVTACAAHALAKHAKPILVLLGRSPFPSPEPEWLASIEDEPAIKKAILENEFNGKAASPIQLEKAFQKHMANREISRNLDMLKSTGSTILYHSVDVRDPDDVNAILDDVRKDYGPIKGIVHGAGVLKDRLIIDKTLEQFQKVFDTKVKGLGVLLEATKKDDLKYLVLFSSIAARMGNKGQVDYAMANEVLNKIAQNESMTRPDCKVISINWGPWDGGMVSSALKREFARNNIPLIPKDAGAMCMLYEMSGDKNGPVEVVVGANLIPEKNKEKPSALKKKEQLFLSFKREIDVKRCPILESHILDGKPVVPFALMAEWFGHGALHGNPGLFLLGIDDMRLLKGIKLDQGKKVIRLLAGKARKEGSAYHVEVEIRDGIKQGKEVIHSRAKAILTDKLSQPPLFHKAESIDSNRYFRSIDEIYEKILFHGFDLRGIKKIISYSSREMVAQISSAPSPAKWMSEPLRSRWIGDPLVLDSAFQMATLWCFEKKGVVSLPSYCASYRQYRKDFPSEGITAVLKIKKVTDHKMNGDFTFLDQDNLVVAQLTGYEAIMDASLFKAFKPQYATD